MDVIIAILGNTQCTDIRVKTYRFLIPLFIKRIDQGSDIRYPKISTIRNIKFTKIRECEFVIRMEIPGVTSIISNFNNFNWNIVDDRIRRGYLVFTKRKLMGMNLSDILNDKISFHMEGIKIIPLMHVDDDILEDLSMVL